MVILHIGLGEDVSASEDEEIINLLHLCPCLSHYSPLDLEGIVRDIRYEVNLIFEYATVLGV